MARTVAVITGASSGIGEATAYRLAEAGFDLVLAARRGSVLEEVAGQCRQHEIDVITVACDVAIEDDVDRVAQAAVDAFGHFDVWINNAGVGMVGAFTEIPSELFRRVVETNFFGYVYGTRAALRQFKIREQGTVINIDSVFGAYASPYESAYVASKHAIRGFSASLRQELDLQGFQHVDVCTVLPASIDTPFYRNAANNTGREVKAVRPLYKPELVAEAVYQLTQRPLTEVYVGRAGRSAAFLRAITPGAVFERAFGRLMDMSHFRSRPAEPTSGNVFSPSDNTGVHGSWPHMSPRRKMVVAGMAVGLVSAVWLLSRNRQAKDSEM